MYVIGFGGRAESGKTSAANIMVSTAQPDRYEHIEFSDPIVETAQRWLTGISTEPRFLNSTREADLLVQILCHSLKTDVNLCNLKDLPRIDTSYETGLINGEIGTVLNAETKPVHRPLLEWLGLSAIKLTSPNIWSGMVHDKIVGATSRNVDLVTIGGVRSASDYQTVKNSGGIVIRLHRQETGKLNPTEASLKDWSADFEVDNDSTLENLRRQLELIWSKISEES